MMIELSISEQNFVNTLAEEIIFSGWTDESCGNFVGWVKEFQTFSIAINREDAQVGGIYSFAKMNKGYHSSYDYNKNLILEKNNLSLQRISDLLSIYQSPWQECEYATSAHAGL